MAEGGRGGAQSDAGTETALPICSEVEEGPRAGKQGGPRKLDVSPPSLRSSQPCRHLSSAP